MTYTFMHVSFHRTYPFTLDCSGQAEADVDGSRGKGRQMYQKETWRHSKEVLHGSNFQHHPMGGSHRSPCREAFNDQLVWIGHETNERHDTV